MPCKICNDLQHASSEEELQHTRPIRRDDIFDSYMKGCVGCELIYSLCPTDSDEVVVHLDERLSLESWNLPDHNGWAIVPFTMKSRSDGVFIIFQGLITPYRDAMASSANVLSTGPRGTDPRFQFTTHSEMAGRVRK